MPSHAWSEFIESHPNAHLVVATLHEQPDAFPQHDVRLFLALMKRAVGKLPVQGDYAATIARSPQTVDILCAFERQDDADILAGLFRARRDGDTTSAGPGRRFVLDTRAHDRLVEIAGPPTVRKARALRPDAPVPTHNDSRPSGTGPR